MKRHKLLELGNSEPKRLIWMAKLLWRGAVFAILVMFLITEEKPIEAQIQVDPRFGVVEAFWAPGEAAELGIGWERIFVWVLRRIVTSPRTHSGSEARTENRLVHFGGLIGLSQASSHCPI